MLLGDHSEPCIIDDTPQFSETAIAYSRGRAPAIRATPAQTALLKTAYEQSNVVSGEQAKILAEEIKLPPKWVLQWFSRQRTKDRKTDVNYKPRLKIPIASTRGSKLASDPAAFSAAFFSDSSSGTLATGGVSPQEIMTIKSEYQDLGSLALTPSVTGSTSLEEFTPLSISESSVSTPTSGRLDITHEGQTSGNGRKKGPTGSKNRSTLQLGCKLNHASDPSTQTRSADGAGFRLLKLDSPGDTAYGLDLSEGAQVWKTEPDMDAYTQPAPIPTPLERCASTPSASRIYLPHVVPPRRSPIVTSNNAARSAGREIKTHNTPSRFSVVNVALGKSDTSLLQDDPFSSPISTVNSAAETFSHKNAARSVSQTKWCNNRHFMSVSRDSQSVVTPGAQIAEPVLYSKYLGSTAGNRLSKADPPAAVTSSLPNFVETALADSFTEAFHANLSEVLSSDREDNGFMRRGSAFAERYDRRAVTGGHPSTGVTVGHHTSAINPDHLEALDPSRAPLKHLTGILTEYRDDDDSYLGLLVGLQDPAERRKIIGCLSNEELVSDDPLAAAMGLSLLSRLGVL